MKITKHTVVTPWMFENSVLSDSSSSTILQFSVAIQRPSISVGGSNRNPKRTNNTNLQLPILLPPHRRNQIPALNFASVAGMQMLTTQNKQSEAAE